MQLGVEIEQVKGFLHAEEGAELYRRSVEVSALGPVLEIGSYCGKSTIYIGRACQLNDNIVYAVDHHGGSEEHQLGQDYHDPELYDQAADKFDSFNEFRRNIYSAGLDNAVVPLVASSEVASKHWNTPLGMVFIDGGHSMEAALADYRSWSSHIRPGGILAIHDVFINARDGGQAPHTVYKMAQASGLFDHLAIVHTLAVLRRR